MDILYNSKKMFHVIELYHIRTVTEGFGGLRMDLHEKSVDSCGHSCACQWSCEFPLASRAAPLSPGQLETVRHIKNNRITKGTQNREGPYINYKVIVAKGCPSFGYKNISVAG